MTHPTKHPGSPADIDLVCGMTVSEKSDHQTHHEGADYYFCSEHCLKKFTADPAHYLSDRESHIEEEHQQDEKCHGKHAANDSVKQPISGATYTCPMHPEVQSDKPGPCPKCGMALEPMGEPVAATRTEYTCPMHPEIIQDHPGSCPKCGMALEPRTINVEERNEELDYMSWRFWVSAVLAFPVFLLAMVADLIPAWLPDGLSMKTVQWIEFFTRNTGRAVGWLAIFRARMAISGELESEHVYPDRVGCGCGLDLQRHCFIVSWSLSTQHAPRRWDSASLF